MLTLKIISGLWIALSDLKTSAKGKRQIKTTGQIAKVSCVILPLTYLLNGCEAMARGLL